MASFGYWSSPAVCLPNPDPNKVTIATVQDELDPATPYEGTERNVAHSSIDRARRHGVTPEWERA